MRVRIRRFQSGGQGFPPPHGMIRRPHPRHPMLPIGTALIGSLAHAGVIGTDILSAVGCQPTSSALPDIESSGFFVYAGCHQPPARCPVLWPLLTSRGISSPGPPQIRTQSSAAQQPHLPPGLGRTASLCCASSPRPVGLVWDSCSSACGSCLVFLQPDGCPPDLDLG